MIIARFEHENDISATARGLWQYDYGQVLRIENKNIEDGTLMHFAQNNKVIEGIINSNEVEIPSYFLQYSDNIVAYIYTESNTGSEGKTLAKIIMHVESRDEVPNFPKPDEPAYTRLVPSGWNENCVLTTDENGDLKWVNVDGGMATRGDIEEVYDHILEFASYEEVEKMLNKES